MSHFITFSVAGIHMKNAKEQIEQMEYVKNIPNNNLNYVNNETEIFNKNIKHGLLAIYSINATLETIVSILIRELKVSENRKEKNFHDRLNKLINKGIIADDESLNICREVRSIRNKISHWERDGVQLLGTKGYLPYMFGHITPKTDDEQLISKLTRESLEAYIKALEEVINYIYSKIDFKRYPFLERCIEAIKSGCITFN